MPSLSQPSFDSQALDALVRAAMEACQVPGASVGIVHGEEVVYLKGFGVKEAGKEDEVTPDTLFAIGSTTKAFTTTAIAMLVDDGKMAWDDPVRKHIPFFRLSDPLADANVTLRDLVTHRTGVSRHDLLWYGSSLDREEILRRIGLVKPNTSFRSTWEYNNIMYLAAGVAIGKASGGTWEAFLQQRILDPLGMTGACFSVKDVQQAPDRATPHEKDKEKNLKTVPWRNLDNVAPAGSINSGARDLTKWVRFNLGDGTFAGKRLLSAARLAELHTPQMVVGRDEQARAWEPETNMTSYALGWGVQDYHGLLMVHHGGGIDGMRAQISLIPAAKLGVIILANVGNTWMPEALRNSLLDTILGLPQRDWNTLYTELADKMEAEEKKKEAERDAKRHKDTRPSREPAAYTGAYEEPAYGTARVSLENGSLVVQWNCFHLPLEHFHFDTFLAKKDDPPRVNELVAFTLDANGDVDTMIVLGIEFKKAKPNPGD
ncbi:MAG TPA: serine hydrolase [Chthonomonadaceae bacterium]|nr:serine hydrolase [Chthonomonadaceae bacterium]